MAGEKASIEKGILSSTEVRQGEGVAEKPVTRTEKIVENSGQTVDREGKVGTEQANPVQATQVASVSLAVNKQQQAVEKVMSTGLEKFYLAMDPVKQQQFRQAGESTARQVAELLSQSKIKVDKIINLIKAWLRLIPGVNKFFLEQEAKIKTDAILQLKKGGEQ